MHIRWKINDDKILTWNHPFPKDTLIGTSERAAVRLPAFGCWCYQCELLTAQALRVRGGVPSWRWSVRTSASVIKNDLMWTINEKKESILLSFVRENPLLWKPTKWNAWNLSYWTGHCTKSVYCGETNDEHCFVNPWNHGIELMGINSVYGLIHDARVCNFCIDCGMKTRLLCCYEFCAVMMMLCLLSPQSFTSLSLCQYI